LSRKGSESFPSWTSPVRPRSPALRKGWLQLLQTYLRQRYEAATAYVVDSKGAFSQQIDVVVFDRQYSPFIFSYEGQTITRAESVYAVFP